METIDSKRNIFKDNIRNMNDEEFTTWLIDKWDPVVVKDQICKDINNMKEEELDERLKDVDEIKNKIIVKSMKKYLLDP